MATVPVFLVTFSLIIPHMLIKRQLQGQIYTALEPPSPDTSGKQQEGHGEVKREKKPESMREHKIEMGKKKGRKESKSSVQLRSIIVWIFLNY